jgi:hypothetical protein
MPEHFTLRCHLWTLPHALLARLVQTANARPFRGRPAGTVLLVSFDCCRLHDRDDKKSGPRWRLDCHFAFGPGGWPKPRHNHADFGALPPMAQLPEAR